MILGGNFMPNDFENGRVVALDTTYNRDYKLFTENNNKNDNFKMNAIGNIQSKSELSLLFFSNYNMDRIQDMMRYEVYKQSNNKHIISKQSTIELQIIMRSIFLQYAKNLKYNLREQVNELNQLVLSFAVPQIMSEIKQYLGYTREISHMPVPIEHPRNLSSAGTRQIPSVTTTF